MMETNPKARLNGLVVQEMPDEVLVYDLSTNKAHCLNGSAAVIWRACDGSHSVADIVKEFEKSGKGSVSEDFVWLALDQLQENDLLETQIVKRFNGQSRRQVLKTIGLATVVAVPVIASLVAPRSALAVVSCVCAPLNGNLDCTAPGNCNPTCSASRCV
jgi:hypothetical protein